MNISRQDRVRMERAHMLAWPALRAAKVEGWLWRSSGGGSQRANSVSTIDFIGTDVKAAVAEAEARYQAVGAPARFHTFDHTSPPSLAEHLQNRGYRQTESTVTMFKRLGEATAIPGVETRDHVLGSLASGLPCRNHARPACCQRCHTRTNTRATGILRRFTRGANRCDGAMRYRFRLRCHRVCRHTTGSTPQGCCPYCSIDRAALGLETTSQHDSAPGRARKHASKVTIP